MERWDRSIQEDRYYRYRRERESPSFSSTLLDAIYRSIDDGEEEMVLYREGTRKKHGNCTVKAGGGFKEDKDMAGLRRACMIEKWMEKKVSEKVVVCRKSVADCERKSRNARDSSFLKSSSSSSDSSSGGGFSSSEAESVYGILPAESGLGAHRPKPVRTGVSVKTENFGSASDQKAKHEGGSAKAKSRALKIYGDLKKVKQPISPGGRLASFLNSLFTAGNAKKAKISSPSSRGYDKSSANASACSPASSLSRSCLSKTPSSRGNLSSGTKRSVRFYPVSVIVDEDCQPCGHKSLCGDEPRSEKVKTARTSINEELQFHIMERHRRVEEAARDLLRNYQKKVECEFNARSGRNNSSATNAKTNNNYDYGDVEDDDDVDDAASCASSDLFELDNLSAIGIERYREELPVYETTHLDTNLAIANGLIL